MMMTMVMIMMKTADRYNLQTNQHKRTLKRMGPLHRSDVKLGNFVSWRTWTVVHVTFWPSLHADVFSS